MPQMLGKRAKAIRRLVLAKSVQTHSDLIKPMTGLVQPLIFQGDILHMHARVNLKCGCFLLFSSVG